jgi:type II secretory pathway component GspD/PulD (secretin)
MRVTAVWLCGLLAGGLSSGATAGECAKDELTFNFSNLPVRDAFAVLADFAGLRPQVDAAIVESGPIRFVCTNWRVAAQDLARRHNLRLRIEGGVMQVTR